MIRIFRRVWKVLTWVAHLLDQLIIQPQLTDSAAEDFWLGLVALRKGRIPGQLL